MLEYRVTAHRVDSHGSLAACKSAEIALDTDAAGRSDAFNPAELLLAALSACMIKGIERVVPILKFQLRGVEISLHGIRQDSPPKIVSIDYEIATKPIIASTSCIRTCGNSAPSQIRLPGRPS